MSDFAKYLMYFAADLLADEFEPQEIADDFRENKTAYIKAYSEENNIPFPSGRTFFIFTEYEKAAEEALEAIAPNWQASVR